MRDSNKNPITAITNEEISYFGTPEPKDGEEIISERKALMRIINLSFEEDKKWKLDDGQNKLWVTIHDEQFLQNIDNHDIGFSKGDTLEVILKTKQKITPQGLKTDHEILQVLKIHPKPEQLPLFEIQAKNE